MSPLGLSGQGLGVSNRVLALAMGVLLANAVALRNIGISSLIEVGSNHLLSGGGRLGCIADSLGSYHWHVDDVGRNAGGSDRLSADSVHKVFSSTFETIPTRRGVDPFRIAPAYAIGAGIHSIRAGRH